MKKNFLFVIILIPICLFTASLYLKQGHLLPTSKKKKLVQALSQHEMYKKFCQTAIADEEIFKNFKRDPIYNLLNEYVTYEEGEKYLERIQEQTPDFIEPTVLERLQKNDQIGNPRTYAYNQLFFSPTTLQYAKIASDLKSRFGDLKNFKVIEIGGGYGGLCAVLSSLFEISSYTIVDLSPSLDLSKKYLNQLSVKNVQFLHPDALRSGEQYDLVISNYDFTQSASSLQSIYLDKIFAVADRGYIVCNFFPKHFRVRPLAKESLLNKVQRLGITPEILPENPPTGKDNCVLVWGESI